MTESLQSLCDLISDGKLLTAAEVAEKLSVTESTAERKLRDKNIEGVVARLRKASGDADRYTYFDEVGDAKYIRLDGLLFERPKKGQIWHEVEDVTALGEMVPACL